jgi:hypothetical protein
MAEITQINQNEERDLSEKKRLPVRSDIKD